MNVHPRLFTGEKEKSIAIFFLELGVMLICSAQVFNRQVAVSDGNRDPAVSRSFLRSGLYREHFLHPPPDEPGRHGKLHGGMTKLMVYHDDQGWTYAPREADEQTVRGTG
jgi:hypothetical protein